MGALDMVVPVAATRRLTTHVLVADRTVAVAAVGTLTEAGVPALVIELAEAFELCTGTVVLDLSSCTTHGDTVVAVVKRAVVRAHRTKCGFRVATTDRAVASALDSEGILRV
ncbi:hypothetical protein VA596_15765 [Amycolatopsis sp., V23-08]|uniref:STAS domain-containing protein n=1 Tax=Amycolatopsis heterodermiae TaxID=3110235 RepID=A0ABU5R473_9PSEU|nr:hypothetical protein [Amycolatopsis sp., V23-08]MEA5361002.1 hypothetical protein [Amycolatopsis sp., V23-08]